MRNTSIASFDSSNRLGFAAATVAALLAMLTGGWAADIDLAADDSGAPFDFDKRWGPWAEIGGAYGTEESSFGELTIFAPLTQTDDSLLFTELQARYFEGDIIEGNAALGYRRMSPSGFNFGVWAGLDIRRTDSDNTFGQVSGGLEALSQYFDARVNGYLPFTDAQTADGMAEIVLEGSNIFMIGGEEVALYGIDGEIGGRLPLASDNRATLGVYGGGFWFDHDDAYEAISGGKARLELALTDVIGAGSEITAQYAYSHDNVRGDRHFVGGALRIPLGATTPARDRTAQEWRMVDGLERDTDIVIGQSDAESVEDARTGVDFAAVQYVDGGPMVDPDSGTDEKLIVATGDFSGPQTLDGDRTLQGGGSTIPVRGLRSGVVADFTAPGSRPEILSSTGSGLTLEGDNIHVAGLDIETSGDNNGMSAGSNRRNIAIEQMDLATVDAEARAIRFGDDNTDIWVAHNIVTAAGDAIRFGIGNGNIWVTDNAVASAAGGQAIRFGDGNRDVWVTDNTVTAQGDGAQGIRFGAGNENVKLSENTFNTIDGDVFVFSGPGADSELAAGSTGNVVTVAPGDKICDGSGGFVGTLVVTDQNGDLLIFEDGCTQ